MTHVSALPGSCAIRGQTVRSRCIKICHCPLESQSCVGHSALLASRSPPAPFQCPRSVFQDFQCSPLPLPPARLPPAMTSSRPFFTVREVLLTNSNVPPSRPRSPLRSLRTLRLKTLRPGPRKRQRRAVCVRLRFSIPPPTPFQCPRSGLSSPSMFPPPAPLPPPSASSRRFPALFFAFCGGPPHRPHFPTVGKPRATFSNHWKIASHFSNHWETTARRPHHDDQMLGPADLSHHWRDDFVVLVQCENGLVAPLGLGFPRSLPAIRPHPSYRGAAETPENDHPPHGSRKILSAPAGAKNRSRKASGGQKLPFGVKFESQKVQFGVFSPGRTAPSRASARRSCQTGRCGTSSSSGKTLPWRGRSGRRSRR